MVYGPIHNGLFCACHMHKTAPSCAGRNGGLCIGFLRADTEEKKIRKATLYCLNFEIPV